MVMYQVHKRICGTSIDPQNQTARSPPLFIHFSFLNMIRLAVANVYGVLVCDLFFIPFPIMSKASYADNKKTY